MKIAILHYHLNPGGVTQVIRNHLRALGEAEAEGQVEKVVILAGARLEGWRDEWLADCGGMKIERRELPALDYDTGEAPPPSELAAAIERELAASGLSSDDALLHVHNHTLGKNLALPGALDELAERGWPLLLQIHDFAEDFRPENYRRQLQALGQGDRQQLAERLYPQRGRLHYAVLNGRDRRVLSEAGMQAERLHLLPNPVTVPVELPPREQARRRLAEHAGIPEEAPFYLYPVRGIRRKNVGELLLWAAAGGAGQHFGITLPPKNPLERKGYDRWQRLASELRLPCSFSLGAEEGLTYAENLAAADHIITTSVAEGFGMVFLESWLLGRGLVGRDLPEITGDFMAAGVRYEHLSDRVRVPVAWCDEARWRAELSEAFLEVLAAYEVAAPSEGEIAAQLTAMIDDEGAVDFASLSPELQRVVIEQVSTDGASRERLWELNERMRAALAREAASPAELAVVESNRKAIEEHYSFGVSGRRLLDLYRTAMASPPADAPALDGERMLGAFISLERFHPVRVET